MLGLLSSSSGLILPNALPLGSEARATARMGCVEEFSISKEIKSVRIFDGDYVRTSTCLSLKYGSSTAARAAGG